MNDLLLGCRVAQACTNVCSGNSGRSCVFLLKNQTDCELASTSAKHFFLCVSVSYKQTPALRGAGGADNLNFKNTLPHFFTRSLRHAACKTQQSSYWGSQLHEQLWCCFSVVVIQACDGQRAMNRSTLFIKHNNLYLKTHFHWTTAIMVKLFMFFTLLCE